MSASPSPKKPDSPDPPLQEVSDKDIEDREIEDREIKEKEAKAVETFFFEVSAGSKTGVDQSAAPPAPPAKGVQAAERASAVKCAPADAGGQKRPSKKVSTTVAERSLPQVRRAASCAKPVKRAAVARARGAAPSDEAILGGIAVHHQEEQPLKRGRRDLPSSTISLIVHVAIIFLLSIYTLALPPKEEDLGFYTSTATYEDVEDFQDLEIGPNEELESLEARLATEITDPGATPFGDLSAESALADVSGDTVFNSDSLGDLGDLFGEAGSGMDEAGEGLGAAATASFFGTKIEGNRILYILDNSGGMKGGKFETLVDELLKSVGSLQPKQQFYVIFYSDTVYPLFYPQPATSFVRPTDKNTNFLREWLDTVELCVGNSIDEALEAALVIQPDTVFLLTDGELFTTETKKRMLLDGASREFPISTFGMGAGETSKFVSELRQVAEANRGTYRTIDVSPEAANRAREKNRPSRGSGEPGPVWGRAL
ncbi:MAG: hypothetical protein MK171_09500 [Pirellulales bacterium]|nr:hypothetical protein [Pirellulales bacterium]